MKTLALLAAALLAALGGGAAALGLLRLAVEMRAPRARCSVCGCEVESDPLDAAPRCGWHWGTGGDA